MVNLKKETIKKNIFLTLSIIFAFIFIAGLMYTIMGEGSPVKFIINEKPVKIVITPMLVFSILFVLYRNSKNVIKENEK